MRSHTLVRGLWFGLVVLAATVAPGEEPTPTTPQERYRILVERNIFDRERGRVSQEAAAAAQASPRPGRYLFLAGTVVGRGPGVAFFEDMRGGTLKVRTGEAVADVAVVKRITLDFVLVEQDGETSTVRIGESLEGGPPVAMASGAGKSSVGPAASSAAVAAPPPDMASQAGILERMRQRRKTELGGR